LRPVIVGAGGVGLALASCLHASGHPLELVVRNEAAAAALRAEGLARTGLFGEAAVPAGALRIHRSLAELAGRAPDVLLVCTKTTAVDELARTLGELWHALDSEPLVVLFLNGWGSAERFAARIPRDRIYNARVITGFARRSPTRVEVTVHADAILLGSLFGEPAERVAPLARAIDAGGLPCRTSERIEADLLAKLLYNCLLNPLGALLGVPYGRLGESAETRALMEALAREIFAVLDAAGRRTHWPDAATYLDVFYRELLPPTARHLSSMRQDLEAGRPTEIDALCGAVVRLAACHGAEAPLCAALTTLVHAAQ
jgi:2-dehydropantoate 2-reductase